MGIEIEKSLIEPKMVIELDDEPLIRMLADPHMINSETCKRAKIELGEDSQLLSRNIIALRDRILEHPELRARIDDVFLSAFLRTKKHNVEKSFESVKKFYNIQRTYPVHFDFFLPSEKCYLLKKPLLVVCPQSDYLGRKVVLGFPRHINVDKFKIEDVFQYATTLLRLLMEDPQLQVVGLVLVLDLAGFTLLQQARIITPTVAWLIVNIIQECIPFRLREIHIINQAFHFSALFAMFSPFLKEKLRKKIRLHGKNYASLHAEVSPKILPPEFGGSGATLAHDFAATNRFLMSCEDKIKGLRRLTEKDIEVNS
ncbi:unnamed protein product [Bemisia tabaci]|uniref:CRAL-TRIO domain-containing protein n=1 Tax=Bemisia tabaci TaxID=7038 RepID=A0A9P0ADF0_BEMTA|nr:unnamed protein product [Bemisia tabaci]